MIVSAHASRPSCLTAFAVFILGGILLHSQSVNAPKDYNAPQATPSQSPK